MRGFINLLLLAGLLFVNVLPVFAEAGFSDYKSEDFRLDYGGIVTGADYLQSNDFVLKEGPTSVETNSQSNDFQIRTINLIPDSEIILPPEEEDEPEPPRNGGGGSGPIDNFGEQPEEVLPEQEVEDDILFSFDVNGDFVIPDFPEEIDENVVEAEVPDEITQPVFPVDVIDQVEDLEVEILSPETLEIPEGGEVYIGGDVNLSFNGLLLMMITGFIAVFNAIILMIII